MQRGPFINEKLIERKLSESDKDLLIANLQEELSEAKTQIKDMSLIVADLMGGR